MQAAAQEQSEEPGEESQDGDEMQVDVGDQNVGAAGGGDESPPGRRYPVRQNRGQLPARYIAQAAVLRNIIVPESYEEAMTSKEAVHWQQAMDEEIVSLTANDTWDLVKPPLGLNVIPTKWVYAVKRNADGEIERYKARFVAKGFRQKEGVDFDEVFAPTCNQVTVRSFLAMATEKGYDIQHLDVRTAFLNGELEEEVYCDQAPGYEAGGAGMKCKLKRALYGLRQASRAWHKKLHGTLEQLGFQVSMSDPALFVSYGQSYTIWLLVHVDDLLIMGSNKVEVQTMKEKLMREYDMRDLGEVSLFLGMEVERNKAG
ncbi:hypothetical protein VaNZ11_011601, partial [Volvox africanus]